VLFRSLAECTEDGQDPWSQGRHVACCGSLSECLKDWSGSVTWHYRCLKSCEAPKECTLVGKDPWSQGRNVDCCAPLSACLKDWSGSGTQSYMCLERCDGGECTPAGQDPWSQSLKVPCCAPTVECLRDWSGNGQQDFRCVDQCDIPSAKFHPHFDTSPDYLNIAARASGVRGNPGRLSDNFYLVVADQGACGGGAAGCCAMQREVAQKMAKYVRERRASNPNSRLLFILACGDNFYWTGASAGRFRGGWVDVYDSELTGVPWFAVMGNHDYGDADPGSGCPNVNPRFSCHRGEAGSAACGGAKPYSTETQGYSSNQLMPEKGGVDGGIRQNYHMPDYTYFYTIPELNFELIAMDWNVDQFDRIGGRGTCRGCGAERLLQTCGSNDAIRASLQSIKEASSELMRLRSSLATSKNVAIINHYPDEFIGGVDLRQRYLAGMPAHARGSTKVFHFFGHTHVQECRGRDSSGRCVKFLTGGSGGCCSGRDTPAGFVAVSWDAQGSQTVECFTPDSPCTVLAYAASPSRATEKAEVCNRTKDDPRCPGYLPADLPVWNSSSTTTSLS